MEYFEKAQTEAIRDKTDLSINDYINLKRIYNSCLDIKNTNNSFLYIALNNGFNSLEYFSETFKKVIGVTPSDYKKSTYFIIKLDDKKLFLIREKIAAIDKLLVKIENYLSRRKPKQEMKKQLSIY